MTCLTTTLLPHGDQTGVKQSTEAVTWSRMVETNKGMKLRSCASQKGSGQKESPQIQRAQRGGPGKVHPAPLSTQICPPQWFVCLGGAPERREESPKSLKLDHTSSRGPPRSPRSKQE